MQRITRLPHCAVRHARSRLGTVRCVASRLGVTLIELLIAIAIIATLSAVFLGASRSAMESARSARTKTTISKLHTLLMEQYASYQTRRVDVNEPSGSNLSQAQRADLQLMALRAIMQMEMPDRWSDIFNSTVDNLPPNPGASRLIARRLPSPDGSTDIYSVNVPAVTQIYFRRYNRLQNDPDLTLNQSAECLYQIIMLLTGDGEARTLFSSQDIGDTDEDGAPEFLDGWGNPIQFIRWPTGFVSSLQPLDDTLSPPTHNAITDHDPFDPFQRDLLNSGSLVPHLSNAESAYRSVPVILSTGSDGESGVNSKSDDYVAPIDPYFFASGDTLPGTILDPELAADNIHNHLIDNR